MNTAWNLPKTNDVVLVEIECAEMFNPVGSRTSEILLKGLV
jgi:hypothetical protein